MITKYIEKIIDLRQKNNLSQEQVAKSIGVSRPTYTAIESGKQQLNTDSAQKMASMYGITVDELLSGEISDMEKYKQMIIMFLRSNISKDGKVTKTKLAKLLYLADFSWFYSNLESMSGMQYRKIKYGPVPDAFFRAIEELEMDGKIKIERKYSDEKDMVLISEAESNRNQKINTLNKEENRLIKDIAKKWKNKKTLDIVNFTHNQLPYFLCRDGEIIPYELITQEDSDVIY